MAERQPDSPVAQQRGATAQKSADVGLLERIAKVSHTLASRRQGIASELATVTTESRELVRAVSHIDSRLSKLAARQRVLQARRTTLDSDARRSLRTSVWEAMSTDRAAVASHDGRSRLAVTWLVSLTADSDHNWTAEMWAPVAKHMGSSGTEVALWETVVSACEAISQELHGQRGLPESISHHKLVGMRVRAPKGWSRDQLAKTMCIVLDRIRVQAVPLHQLRCEVSVVWLDLPRAAERSPAHGPEEADTLVGEGLS